MASLRYLLANKANFKFGSKFFFIAWAKRFLTLKEIIKRNQVRNYLNKKGAKINETAEIGNVKVNGSKKNLEIGAFSFVGEVEFALHDKIIIGKNVCINDGAKILTASHDLNDSEWKHIKKPIVIEDYVWIATDAIILPGVHIGKGAVVAAGAVVSKSIEAFTIVAGNPAKPLSKKRTENLNYNPCEFLAANLAWLKG